jgi:hypothetical protein
VDAILSSVSRAHSEDDVHTIVHETFVQSFGSDVAGARERYAELASAVWQAVVKSRRR